MRLTMAPILASAKSHVAPSAEIRRVWIAVCFSVSRVVRLTVSPLMVQRALCPLERNSPCCDCCALYFVCLSVRRVVEATLEEKVACRCVVRAQSGPTRSRKQCDVRKGCLLDYETPDKDT